MKKMISSAKHFGLNQMKLAALVFLFGIVGTGCGSGGDGQTRAEAEILGGNGQVAAASQASLKMELCAEIDGWAMGCRFLGMQVAELEQKEIDPLTEKYSRGALED
ncbi:MAG: hypothetical protein ACE5F7_07315 [Nitrospiria bacterium]